jgi:hypothetical protein
MATKKNDPVKPKKDKWGRSEGSKYYSFNPETKKYEDKEKQKALESKRAAADSRGKLLGDPELMKTPRPAIFKEGGSTITPKAKTGGMVNSNAKVVASKVAKGTVGRKSNAPKTPVPKAKYGMSMRRK